VSAPELLLFVLAPERILADQATLEIEALVAAAAAKGMVLILNRFLKLGATTRIAAALALRGHVVSPIPKSKS
jgi:hypothetical protein